MSDLRALLQPPPATWAAPTPLAAITLNVSASDSPTCPHVVVYTVSSTPADNVIVELAVGAVWQEVLSNGVTEAPKPVVMSPPNRTTGKYTESTTLTFRARPKPGFIGNTVYSTVNRNNSTPGAYLSGVAGFKVTRTAATTCNLVLRPSGTAHEAYGTNFDKFTCNAQLYLYATKPILSAGGATPAPTWASAVTPIPYVASAVATYALNGFLIPDLGAGPIYATVFAGWSTQVCTGCANAALVAAQVGTYPLVLKVESP